MIAPCTEKSLNVDHIAENTSNLAKDSISARVSKPGSQLAVGDGTLRQAFITAGHFY